MRKQLPSIVAITASLALVPLTGCDLEVGDLNNPGLDDLENNPTRSNISSASVGLMIGNRRNRAAANGYVSQLGILGRESYNFDGADPRYIGELLAGTLQPGSPFGGNFWAGPYANMRLANLVQRGVEQVAEFSPQEKAAILGWSKTIEATDLLEIAVTRDSNGAVIDTDRELDAELAPVVSVEDTYTQIAKLLDEAAEHLSMAGAAFPFTPSPGYAGFNTPENYRKFNRGMRARVAVYAKDYPAAITALGDSFINDEAATVAALNAGVSHVYSTNSGDAVNGLINRNIFAAPSIVTDAQSNGATKDLRLTRKTTQVPPEMARSSGGLSSDIRFTIYSGPTAALPIMRNEELLLLRAEARWFTGNREGAIDDLNVVRTVSGGLAEIMPEPTVDDDFLTALLYERRYSLLFEGGHRWIDTRRLGKIETLPLEVDGHQRNVRYPIPLAECNARPGEPRCALGSS